MNKSIAVIIGLLFLSSCSTATPAPTLQPVETASPAATVTSSPTSTTTPTLRPTLTSTPYPPVSPQIAAGDYHTCYLSASGRVTCWGWNHFGQIGVDVGQDQILPGQWVNLQGIVQISAGAYHTCAVDTNHQVFCWGRNNMGQLGTGDTDDRSVPVKVAGLENISIDSVTAGSVHTCAFEKGGRAWCWGSNRDGKLGSGETAPYSAAPEAVDLPVDRVVSMSAGATFTCAASETGQTWCWGDGFFGETGNPLLKSSALPEEISQPIPGISQLPSGWFHTCALTDDGGISCWGKNLEGELGNSSTVSSADPVYVAGITGKKDVRLIAAGGRSTCAVTADNQVYCWGKNNYGQLGDGTTTDSLLPVKVPSVESKIVDLIVGASHACYLTENGQLWCWGANDHLQAGAAYPALVVTPVQIDIPSD
jgi:alpha-tubulin suppressor-like RCC1 family protein